MHAVCRAFSRARANTGKRMAARIAIMAMTTSSSISVNPFADLQLQSMAELSPCDDSDEFGFRPHPDPSPSQGEGGFIRRLRYRKRVFRPAGSAGAGPRRPESGCG